MNMNATNRSLPVVAVAVSLLLASTARAATPGITGPSFTLTAQPAFLNQPDGAQVYAWGYGCSTLPAGFAPAMPGQNCPSMQVPGPTLIVTEGQTVTVTLTNGLPGSAGNTSILFPGFHVTATGGVAGLLAQEAVPGGTVTYSFTASTPGTRAYYSGTQGDLQIEMGLYGAVVVLPATVPANCTTGLAAANVAVEAANRETDWRLANASGAKGAAYDHPGSCYDREYLFQFAEMDPGIHRKALEQVTAKGPCSAGAPGCSLEVPTEPYHPGYFLVNGRSMPDDMDPNFDAVYPHQPYNGNPHMHPGELTLIRVIGQGRWQHPFHEHGNHVRVLARDGNLILSSSTTPVAYSTGGATVSALALAGPLLFTTDTTPGQAFDGIFYWTGRGLNWDAYGHTGNLADPDPLAKLPCSPDSNGYYTVNSPSPAPVSTANYFEWCQDHNKPVQATPVGDVPSGGPATLPDPNIFTNGAWYGGTPYLGPDATLRAGNPACASTPGANCSLLQPANTQANPPNERGFAFMWHSHNEREITTNNVFPGGMLMMMLVDSREFAIDESL
jgi:FtsP/CotA-like multicopper oxidase with cupredoxin domain